MKKQENQTLPTLLLGLVFILLSTIFTFSANLSNLLLIIGCGITAFGFVKNYSGKGEE